MYLKKKKRKCSSRLEIVQPCRKLHFILLLGSDILTQFPVLVPDFVLMYYLFIFKAQI